MKAITLGERAYFDALSEAQVAFAKKVYLLLALAMAVFTGAAVYAGHNVQTFLPYSQALSWGGFGLLLARAFIPALRPLSALILFAFVTLTGLSLGPYLSVLLMVDPRLVIVSGGATLAIFGALTAYTHISGKDFTYLYGFLWVALVAMIVLSLIQIFFPFGSAMHTVMNYAGALLFTAYILADTSAVTRQYFAVNDASGAALALFLDLINLFLYLLSLFSRRD